MPSFKEDKGKKTPITNEQIRKAVEIPIATIFIVLIASIAYPVLLIYLIPSFIILLIIIVVTGFKKYQNEDRSYKSIKQNIYSVQNDKFNSHDPLVNLSFLRQAYKNQNKLIPRILKESLIRDLAILDNSNYIFYRTINLEDNLYFYFFNSYTNSCLRLFIESEDLQWYWTPLEFSSSVIAQDSVEIMFPRVYFSLDNSVQGLVAFAIKVHQRGGIHTEIDSEGIINVGNATKLISELLSTNEIKSIGDRPILFPKDSENYGFRITSVNSQEKEKLNSRWKMVNLFE